MKKNIAYVASECQPFFTSGGLADVIGSLPKSIVKETKKFDICVFAPLYKKINPEYDGKVSFVTSIDVQLSWRHQLCNLYTYSLNGIKYYFIGNEYYFDRDKIYGYFDDCERFAFFSKAVIECILHLNLNIDIIHCHDWQSGMVSVYLRTLYYHNEAFKNTKRIFTIHNIEYQGVYSFDSDILQDVFGINNNDGYLLEFDGQINIMKGAMECSNYVTTVSPNYAEEIKTPVFAHNLENEVLRVCNEGKLLGILNGIDYDFYNPLTDKCLFNNYSAQDINLRKVNKDSLLKMLNFESENDVPVIGMVSRLVWHKGLDILKRSIEELMKMDLKLIILGTGDSYYESYFGELEKRYPNKLKVIFAFNQDLSRKIYSAVDFFLMPSESEPCGLSQMIASRYGAIPMVRETGGLKDSIVDFSSENGNGFTFSSRSEKDLIGMVIRAINLYNSGKIDEYVKVCMEKDFSWSNSAKEYIRMYENILK